MSQGVMGYVQSLGVMEYVQSFFEEEEAPPPESSSVDITYDTNRDGNIIRPPADGEPVQGLSSNLERLGYAPGHIDMINELALSYDGINAENLTGTILALRGDEELRNDVMDALMDNDQELAHRAAQAFEQDPVLLEQFEYMVRHEPDQVREILPAMQNEPGRFHEFIRNNGPDAEVAIEANRAAADNSFVDQLNQMWDQLMSGDMRFADLLGPQIGGFFDQIFGPMMDMIQGLAGTVNGFVSQNVGPAGRDALEAAGLDPDNVIDVGPDSEPAGPSREPENDIDPNRDVLATPNPHTM